ncbi:MAG: outer membrane lipoprotein chaperone LolA [Burkholderiaceae bacterium]
MTTKRLLAGLAFALGCAGAWADGMQSLDSFVKTVNSGRADFTQVVTAPTRAGQPARTKASSGTFEFARPGRFRFVYRKPFEQTIVADGQTLWLYDVDLNQVTARKQAEVLGSTPAAVIASAPDLRALQASFTLENGPEKGGLEWVVATPKVKDGQLQKVSVGFKTGAATPMLASLEILDNFGQLSVLTFDHLEVNVALPAGTFAFKPPAGADVVRQ